ncbi:MAG TPA: MFS transporter [Steroidobacteraceae bacterium]|jgi:SHS family lactate transporter-like MFS transporter|nr:MFS transporter [Steroidobacteraceae bacterium]
MFDALKGWTPVQRKVVAASFLGWTLDAFDFFLLVFVMKDVAREFGTTRDTVAWAVTLTLALRPIGAFIFGRLADHFGRRPILMLDVALYSLMGLASALAPNLAAFLIVRALFGVAMGGEWGIGASLTMESVKPQARGLVSGLLQSGYPTGYLLASLVFALLYDRIGWRGMFVIGFAPALLVLYIRRHVPESPTWQAKRAGSDSIIKTLGRHWRLALYAILLMTAFNFFSHGTQDLYPNFLQSTYHFDARTTGTIAIVYNIGAILGGWTIGIWSQRVGRRRAMIVAALVALPITYLWAYSSGAVMLAAGAFLMQFCVQGAWGAVPAYLIEVSPPDARATFPGTVYQIGNFIASSNAVLQSWFATQQRGNYALALAGVAMTAALSIAVLAWLGRETRGVETVLT